MDSVLMLHHPSLQNLNAFYLATISIQYFSDYFNTVLVLVLISRVAREWKF